jgi:pimeloyl-ACP methyl ester carboxylesterase
MGPLAAQDSSNHSAESIQFVTVDKEVKLEVIDWGGTGRPMIFLAGMNNTAHDFGGFARQFTKDHHVYGITRRGFGASSKPVPAGGNYTADRLGDDILAVMHTLHINRPILVGHSFAGEEMSSIGSRFPASVAGLVYLDAAYGFAYYDPAHPLMELEMNDLKRRIDQVEAGGIDEKKALLELEASVSEFEKTLHNNNVGVASMPPIPPRPPIQAALNFGVQKYTSIPVPILAIFACPHNWDRMPDAAMRATRLAADKVSCAAQAKTFAAGVPSAHVVLIPGADHYVFNSNPAEVIRDMNDFLGTLP